MKTLLLPLVLIFSISLPALGAKSDLVDVNKDSKLSDYFKKINPKVSDNPEEKPIAKKVEKSLDDKSLAEEEILLSAAKTKTKKSSSMSPVNKMIVAMAALLVIAKLFFVGVGKMNKNKGHAEIAKNITVLTQKPIGPKKNLMLIRVAGETILLGVTDHNINHIKTLSLMDDELPKYTEPKFKNQLEEKIEQTKITDETEEVDGFAVSRLDDVKKAVSQRFSI